MLYPKGRDDLNCIITREIITRDANTSDITGARARARTYYNRAYLAGVVKVNCLARKKKPSVQQEGFDGINISVMGVPMKF